MMGQVGAGSRCEPFAPSGGGGERQGPGPAWGPLEVVLSEQLAAQSLPLSKGGSSLGRV